MWGPDKQPKEGSFYHNLTPEEAKVAAEREHGLGSTVKSIAMEAAGKFPSSSRAPPI